MDINVNDEVHVELTDEGVRVYKQWHDDISHVLTAVNALLIRQVGYGWYKFQMWELMNIFGPHMHNGCPAYFVDNRIRTLKPK